MDIYVLTCQTFLFWLIIQIIKEAILGIKGLMKLLIVYFNEKNDTVNKIE